MPYSNKQEFSGVLGSDVDSSEIQDNTIVAADINSSAKSGSDTVLITGTAGTSGNLVEWNGDGDAVDSSVASSALMTESSTNTLTNKTFDANATGNALSNVETADIASGS